MLKQLISQSASWTLIFLVVMFFVRLASAVELSVEDTSGVVGEEVMVSILIDDAADLLSADITLSYGQGILTATGAATTSLTSNCIIAHTVNWGEISLSLASDSALTGGSGTLVDVTFSISEDAEEEEVLIIVSEPTIYGSDYQVKTVTTVDGTVTITSGSITTTTTTDSQSCLSEVLYGENSGETERLRYFRDNVITQSPEGQELIRLYYQWSPAIVKAMEEDEAFKAEVKEKIDGILELIEREAE